MLRLLIVVVVVGLKDCHSFSVVEVVHPLLLLQRYQHHQLQHLLVVAELKSELELELKH